MIIYKRPVVKSSGKTCTVQVQADDRWRVWPVSVPTIDYLSDSYVSCIVYHSAAGYMLSHMHIQPFRDKILLHYIIKF